MRLLSRQSLRLSTTLAAIACIAASCGDKEPAAPATASHGGLLARLVTEATEVTPANRELSEVAAFRMTSKNRSQCPWVDAGPAKRINTQVRPPGGSEDRAKFLPAWAIRGKGPKSYTHEFEFEASDVTTVETFFSCYGSGPERVRAVTIDEDGDVADASDWLAINGRPDPRLHSFELSPAKDLSAKRSGVRIEFEGSLEHGALMAMRALKTPQGARLPKVGDAETLRGGREWRRSAGLLEGSDWTVDVMNNEPDEGPIRLTMDLFIPSSASRSTKGSRIVVSAQGEAGPMEVTIDVPNKAVNGWTSVDAQLLGLAKGKSSVVLSLQDDDAAQTASIAIGDAVIVQRAAGAKIVLLITSDTHRADHLSAADSAAFVDTPALDRLGRRGVFFTDCQSTTNVTNPSHITVMTGIHPRDTQVVDNKTAISKDVRTISDVFADNGYRTFASISTQHLDPSQSGLGQGFDRFEAPEEFKRSGNVAVDQVAEWLEEADGQSVFAWIHMFDAHAPYAPPSKFVSKRTEGISRKSDDGLGVDERYVPSWVKNAGIENPEYVSALYRGEVDWLDSSLSELLDGPRMEDATIAFTSDHGESFRTHNVYWDHAGLYLPMVAVPLIIVDPNIDSLRTDVSVQQMDVGRTLVELAGIDEDFRGRNVVQLAIDEAADEPRYAIAAHGLQASITLGKWFLVMDLRTYSTDPVEHTWIKGRTQLFDRTKGPDTEEDLSAEFPEMEERLRENLVAFLLDSKGLGLGQSSQLNAAAQANLQALGYAAFTSRTTTTWWEPEEDAGSEGE